MTTVALDAVISNTKAEDFIDSQCGIYVPCFRESTNVSSSDTTTSFNDD